MKLRVLLVISILLLASCGLALSEKDKASVQTIVSTWGGTCTYSKSASISSEKGKRKTFKLTLENSPAFDSDIKKETIASNMALTMYKGWTEEQRNSYTHVSATLKHNGNTYENEYSVAEIKAALGKEALFHSHATQVEHHNLKEILKHMNPAYYADSNVVQMTKRAATQDSIYGPVVSSKLLGFRFSDQELSGQKVHLLHLYGFIERKKEKVSFTLVIDPLKKTDEYYLYYFNF
jgi:hypothetical protein